MDDEARRRMAALLHHRTGQLAPGDPLAQLKACGLAHIDFMIANPRLDELCWQSDMIDRSHPPLQAAQSRLAGDLITKMSAATGQTLNPDKESNPSTLLAIAIVHGFAQMVNERMILTDVPEGSLMRVEQSDAPHVVHLPRTP